MKILAIDSSGMTAAVALLEDDKLTAEYNVNYKKTHSQTLLPMLDEIRQMTELDLNTVDYVAVASGPGSFTGLRIGSATAKGLCLALNRPLVEVPTLEGLACNLWGTQDLVCPMMDARRNQVYTALYRFVGEDAADGGESCRLEIVKEQCAVPVEEIVEAVNQLGQSVIFLGDGASAYEQEIRELTKVPYRFAPAALNQQRGSSVALRAVWYIREGRAIPGAKHKPEYLRVSQAERERAQRLEEEKAQSDHAQTESTQADKAGIAKTQSDYAQTNGAVTDEA